MKLPNSATTLAVSALIGLALGYIGGPVYVLVLWAAAGLVIGYLSSRKLTALAGGALFGFVLSFVFMVHGYTGTDPIVSKLLPFAALGAFGAVCGALLSLGGRLAHSLADKLTAKQNR